MTIIMRIGLTYDLRSDYNIESLSEIYADFCCPDEIGYLANAIKDCGHEVVMIGNMFKLNKMIKEKNLDCDLVFIEDEGINSRNREAIVPALLEVNNIPFIGSDAYAMGLSQNKFHTKLVAQHLGIRTPKYIYITYIQSGTEGFASIEGFLKDEMVKNKLSFPMIVKPNYEGYSMGVFIVNNLQEMVQKVRWNMDTYHQEVLCEEYISGKEVYVPIVGTGDKAYALGVGICKHGDGSDIDVFTLHNKCFEPIIDEIYDCKDQLRSELISTSIKLHKHLNCFDFGRSDFKVDKNGVPYFLEINPRPGLTQNGPYETCAKSIGKTYSQIIGEIIQSAVDRNFKNNPTATY